MNASPSQQWSKRKAIRAMVPARIFLPTLTRYASRQFVLHLAITLIGLVALTQLMDLLNSATELMERHAGGLLTIGTYALLRLPETTTMMLPFSILLASLVTLGRLSIHNEILALKAAGMPYRWLLYALIPGVLGASVLHLVIADQVAPPAFRALLAWDAKAAEDTAGRLPTPGDPVWIRAEGMTVRANIVANEGRRVLGITLFRRDADDNLLSIVVAERAEYVSGKWILSGVQSLVVSQGAGGAYQNVERMNWDTSLTPSHFSDTAARPAGLSMLELLRFVMQPGIGAHAPYFYATWLHERLSIPIASLVMLLLAAPVTQGMQRQGGVASGMAIGIGLGFLYFVADGFVLALGEAGTVPPLLAAWSPTLLFASLGIAWLLRVEGY
jgi:lipopolysaccharide export system permease protein